MSGFDNLPTILSPISDTLSILSNGVRLIYACSRYLSDPFKKICRGYIWLREPDVCTV
jgi:hypothetical protein